MLDPQVVNNLQALYQLFIPEGSWMQGGYWRSMRKIPIDGCYCLMGGIYRVIAGKCEFSPIARRAPTCEAIEAVIGANIITWNDDPSRKHGDILHAIRLTLESNGHSLHETQA